jgi:hypothetical protein
MDLSRCFSGNNIAVFLSHIAIFLSHIAIFLSNIANDFYLKQPTFYLNPPTLKLKGIEVNLKLPALNLKGIEVNLKPPAFYLKGIGENLGLQAYLSSAPSPCRNSLDARSASLSHRGGRGLQGRAGVLLLQWENAGDWPADFMVKRPDGFEIPRLASVRLY